MPQHVLLYEVKPSGQYLLYVEGVHVHVRHTIIILLIEVVIYICLRLHQLIFTWKEQSEY